MSEAVIRRLLDGEPRALMDAAETSLASLARRLRPAPVACFEPRMRGPQGHYPLLAEAHARLCREAGADLNVFHHRDWEPSPSDGWHGAFPVVDHLVGAGAPVDRSVLDAFTAMTRRIVSECAARSGARVALFPTARFLTLPGIAEAVRDAPGLRAAVIGVMETSPVPDCDDPALVTDAFRSAAATLADCAKADGESTRDEAAGPAKEILLVAESAAIAEALIHYGFDGGNVLVAPYPAAARFDVPGGASRPREQPQIGAQRPAGAQPQIRTRPRIGALGATRPVHQPARLAAYLLEAHNDDVDWCVRLDPAQAAEPLGMAPEGLESALRERGVNLLPRHLPQRDYDATLAALDVMLLPYGERYRSIGSGIFLECVCAGVVPLVPAGTTMRALYERLGGRAPAITGSSPADLGAAVDACLADLPALRANALAVRRAWLAHEHGPASWRRRVGALIERACAA